MAASRRILGAITGLRALCRLLTVLVAGLGQKASREPNTHSDEKDRSATGETDEHADSGASTVLAKREMRRVLRRGYQKELHLSLRVRAVPACAGRSIS